MACHETFLGRTKSLAGAALVGLGMFALYGSVTAVFAGVRQVLGANGAETVGVSPAGVFAVSQALHSSGSHHQFVYGLVLHMLMASWPLLLLMAGTVLTREEYTDNSNSASEKRF